MLQCALDHLLTRRLFDAGFITRGRDVALFTAAIAVCAAWPAQALGDDDDAVVLIDRALSRTTVAISVVDVSTEQRMIAGHVIDDGERGDLRQWGRDGADEALALIRVDAAAEPNDRQRVLELADGQRIVGRPRPAQQADEPETVTWLRGDDFSMTVPIDAVRRVVFDDTAADLRPDDADVVLLRNGDRLDGFVLSLGDPIQIELEPDDPGDPPRVVDVERRRVSGVAMLTPLRDPDSGQPFSIWLNDGSLLHASELQHGGGRSLDVVLPIEDDGETSAALSMRSVTAMVFDRKNWRPLAMRQPQRVDGPVTRYAIPDPEVADPNAPAGLSEVTFRGPMRAWYDLPGEPVRLAAEVELPEHARMWGRVRLIVRCDGEVVAEHEFDGRRSRSDLDVLLDGSELEIELADAGSGPVQNVLVFRHALFGPADVGEDAPRD